MFDIHNYDPEEYEKERKERLEQEERLKYVPIVGETEYTHHEEESNKKPLFIGLLVAGIVGIAGYFGFSGSEEDSCKTKESVAQVKSISELNSSSKKEIESINDSPAKLAGVTTPNIINNTNNESQEVAQKIVQNEKIAKELAEKEKLAEQKAIEAKEKAEKKKLAQKKADEVKEAKKKAEKRRVAQRKASEAKRAKEKARKRELARNKAKREKEAKERAEKRKLAEQQAKEKEVTKKKEKRVVTVKKGDTLGSLAKKFYGNQMEFDKIVRANKRIKSSHTSLRLGEKLWIPRVQKSPSKRMVTVRKGDTLGSIAKRYYGNRMEYKRIIRANYSIKSESTPLDIGQRIYVPR